MVKNRKMKSAVFVVAMVAFCMFSSVFALAADSNTLVDEMANFDLMHEHTENSIIDTSNGEYLGDTERFVRTDAEVAYVVYKMDNIASFEVSSICFTDPFQDIKIYGSADGKSWAEITSYTTEDALNTDAYFTKRTYKSKSVPENTNYIKFEIVKGPFLDAAGAESNWVPQLSKVVLTKSEAQAAPAQTDSKTSDTPAATTNPKTSDAGIMLYATSAFVSASGALLAIRRRVKK